MSLLLTRFEGLTAEDFDVYRPECWSSNVHNLKRMKAKERVLALARIARDKLDLNLELEASSEIPSVWNGRQVSDQWAYLLRTPDERRSLQPVLARRLDLATRVADPAEHHRHALLFIRLDHESLEVGLRANEHATIDLANLLAHAQANGAGLAATLAGLTADIRLGADADPTAGGIVEAAKAARAGEAEWLVVARRIAREDATEQGESLADAAAEVLDALRPLYRFLSWSPDNDHISVASEIETLAAERDEASRAAAERAADKQAARDARQEATRAATAARLAELDAWKKSTFKALPPREEAPPPKRRAAPPSARQTPAEAPDEAPPPAKRAQAKARPAARPKPKPRAEPRPPAAAEARPEAPRSPASKPTTIEFEVGAKCRLNRGLLAGKVGEVTAKEARGYYKVRVGTFEVSVAGADLGVAD